MPLETVGVSNVITAATNLVGGVSAWVAKKQIDPAVIVEVKKDSSRGVAGVVQTGGMADIIKAAISQVLEQMISMADGGDEQIGETIIVHVRKGSRNDDLVG